MKIVCTLLISLIIVGFKPASIYKVTSGVVTFKSNAALELIKASSGELGGMLDTEKKQFAFIVKINSFVGFNSPLQKEHFNENYLETVKYPYASFEGKIIEDIDYKKPGNYTIRAKGILNIHGVPQERIIKIDWIIQEKKVSIKSNFTVLLADHNIAIPKVVHEKLATEIKVDVKADFSIF